MLCGRIGFYKHIKNKCFFGGKNEKNNNIN